MKWRNVFIGAIISLGVAVLGGVVVYYLTKEPDEKKSEKLIYVLNQTASFTGGTQDLAFSSVTVTNEGGLAAKRVSVLVGVNASEIRDLAISSGGGSRELVHERTAKSIRIVYETLLPQESVTVNLLLTNSEKPSINVRSDATLGKERKPPDATSSSRKSKLENLTKELVPGAAALYVLVTLTVFGLRKRLNALPNRNNAGFLLLHHGLIDEAESVLSHAVRAGHCDQLTLSNYALCKAAKGDNDKSMQINQWGQTRLFIN